MTTPAAPNPFDAYAKALDAERAAWEKVKDALPGTPGFDAALWQQWRDCLEASAKALAVRDNDRAAPGS